MTKSPSQKTNKSPNGSLFPGRADFPDTVGEIGGSSKNFDAVGRKGMGDRRHHLTNPSQTSVQKRRGGRRKLKNEQAAMEALV